MCKVAADPSSSSWGPPVGWEHSAAYLHQEGDTRCGAKTASSM
jgi:hypothetical protein